MGAFTTFGSVQLYPKIGNIALSLGRLGTDRVLYSSSLDLDGGPTEMVMRAESTHL